MIIRKSECEEVCLETNNNKALLEDVGQNVDLYIANQEGNRRGVGFNSYSYDA